MSAPAPSRAATTRPAAARRGAVAGLAERADVILPWTLRVVATLRVADLIAAGHRRLDDLAERAGADPDALGRVLRYLVCRGIFREPEPDVFALSPAARMLVDRGPAGLRSLLDQEGIGGRLDAPFSRLLQVVRSGEPAYAATHGHPFWADLAANPELAGVFDALMGVQIGQVADEVAAGYDWPAAGVVVDVGGGTGGLLAAVLRAAPRIRGVLVELDQQAAEAARMLTEAGLAGRYAVAPGSFFDPLPAGDVYLLSSVLHDWPDRDAVRILRGCAAAAGPEGRILIIEALAGSTDLSPELSTMLDLRMLVMMGGRERTEAELRELAVAAGCRITGVYRTPTRTLVECAPAGDGRSAASEAANPRGGVDTVTAAAETQVANPPVGTPRIVPFLIYDDVATAMDWLISAFGFEERPRTRIPGPDDTIEHVELELQGGVVTLGPPSVHGESPSVGCSTMLTLYVDDVDAHYERAVEAGATVMIEPEDTFWGDRRYQCADPFGHRWHFSRHMRDVELPF